MDWWLPKAHGCFPKPVKKQMEYPKQIVPEPPPPPPNPPPPPKKKKKTTPGGFPLHHPPRTFPRGEMPIHRCQRPSVANSAPLRKVFNFQWFNTESPSCFSNFLWFNTENPFMSWREKKGVPVPTPLGQKCAKKDPLPPAGPACGRAAATRRPS